MKTVTIPNHMEPAFCRWLISQGFGLRQVGNGHKAKRPHRRGQYSRPLSQPEPPEAA